MFGKLLPVDGPLRGSAILALGTAISQGMLLLAAPILTRLYTPADFGILAVFLALLGIVGSVASLRYQYAVPLPESEQEAAPLLVLGLLITAVAGCLCLGIYLLFGRTAARLLGAPGLAPYLWVLVVSIVLVGIYELFHYWALRRHAYEALTKTTVARSTVLLIVQLGGAGLGPVSLLVGQAASQLVAVFVLFWRVVRDQMPIISAVRPAQVREAAVRYRRFPQFDTLYSLLAVFAAQMPALLLAGLFGPAAAGLYALTQRVLSAPVALVGDAVTNAFFAAGPEAHRRGVLGTEVTRLHAALAHFAAPVSLSVVFAGPGVFALLFGETWRPSGEFAQWMALALYAQVVIAPLSSVFYVLERQPTSIVFQVISVTLRGSALVIGAWLGDLNLAIALFALMSVASYGLILLWLVGATGARLSVIASDGLGAFTWAVALTSPLALSALLQADNVWFFAACAATGALIIARFIQLARTRAAKGSLEVGSEGLQANARISGGKLLVLDMSYNLEEVQERNLHHSITCRDLDGFFEHVWTVHPAATLNTSEAWGDRLGPPRHVPLAERHTFVEGKVGRFSWLRQLPLLNFAIGQIDLLLRLRRLVLREGVTIIRAGSPLYTGLMGWVLSKLTGAPLALRIAENYDRTYTDTQEPMQPRIFRTRAIEKRVEQFVFRRADLVAGINQDNLNFALANGACPTRSTIFRLGNLVDSRHFTDPAERASATPLLAELGIGEEPFLMVIGRLVELKRPGEVLEVLARVRARDPRIKCLFVGDGPLKERLAARADLLGIGTAAIFCGNRDQDWLARVIPAAACVLSPVTGRALCEAALSAAPVVAYDTEWQAELIQTDVTGELVPFPDLEAFAAATTRLIEDPVRARRLGQTLRASALLMMDPDRLNQFERETYTALLKPRPGADLFQGRGSGK